MPKPKSFPQRMETALARDDAAWVILESQARRVSVSAFLRFLVQHYRAFSPAAQQELFSQIQSESASD